MKINIYGHTHVIHGMETESIQQIFQLISKYEVESSFSTSEFIFSEYVVQ